MDVQHYSPTRARQRSCGTLVVGPDGGNGGNGNGNGDGDGGGLPDVPPLVTLVLAGILAWLVVT